MKHPPVISSLILDPSDPEFSGDLRVPLPTGARDPGAQDAVMWPR